MKRLLACLFASLGVLSPSASANSPPLQIWQPPRLVLSAPAEQAIQLQAVQIRGEVRRHGLPQGQGREPEVVARREDADELGVPARRQRTALDRRVRLVGQVEDAASGLRAGHDERRRVRHRPAGEDDPLARGREAEGVAQPVEHHELEGRRAGAAAPRRRDRLHADREPLAEDRDVRRRTRHAREVARVVAVLLRLEGDVGEQREPLLEVAAPARGRAAEHRRPVVPGALGDGGTVAQGQQVVDRAVDDPVAHAAQLVGSEVEQVGGYVETGGVGHRVRRCSARRGCRPR